MSNINPLTRVLIEKAGYDSGFENRHLISANAVHLSSARYPTTLTVSNNNTDYIVQLLDKPESLESSLDREFVKQDGHYVCQQELDLRVFLTRVAQLSHSLPNQVVNEYEQELSEELADLTPSIQATEIERLVRQRLGQEKYRKAMLEYWDEACAVTGVNIPALLRASHAIPWAECESDVQRLDVFNGFLLSAHLDALFDRFLISFDNTGHILIAPGVDVRQLESLGIHSNMVLRWLDEKHLPYLEWHRKRALGIS